MLELTQHNKILKLMRTDPERWWLPADFMKPALGELFVGYEASARLSELAKMGDLDSKRVGKYMARRLKIKVAPVPLPRPATKIDKNAPLEGQTSLVDVPINQPARRFI